jgi:hypothetical protein
VFRSTNSKPRGLEGVGGQYHAPAALPPGNTRYPFYRRLGGPQGRSGRVRKISPSPGFDPWTVQPVASRYTDRATRPVHVSPLPIKNPVFRLQASTKNLQIYTYTAFTVWNRFKSLVFILADRHQNLGTKNAVLESCNYQSYYTTPKYSRSSGRKRRLSELLSRRWTGEYCK